MADHDRILQLLETALDSGSTPEQVCAEFPELLPRVRERWETCRRIDAEIDALLPPSRSGSRHDRNISAIESAELPAIPGYELRASLGRGGMGIVYKARHLRLNRTIALKMLLAGPYASRSERERFLREARAVAELQHPNIVQIFDVGEFEGRPFFTMEYVEGPTLAASLAGAPQSASHTASMLVTLAMAVESAHKKGIIHRDLKPANILLCADGTPKINDFGLARRVDGEELLTISGAKVGTPSYMAPEQAMGRSDATGPATDVYSLGAILYEMLTGRPPFRGESAMETERQLLVEEPARPSRLNARVPRDLETICLKCLQKDPRRRYGSAAQLADDLERLERGEPILARQTGLPERWVKWVRRHPALATAIASSAVIVAALLGGTMWIVSQRAATEKVVEQDLEEVGRLQLQSAWAQADRELDMATIRLGNLGSQDLRSRLDQAHRDSELVAKLDAIRLSRTTDSNGAIDPRIALSAYNAAFQKAGYGNEFDDPNAVGRRIAHSNIRHALVGALDDWRTCLSIDGNVQTRRDWISQVEQLADHDPTGWRNLVRSPAVWENGDALSKSVDTVDVASQSASLLVAACWQLKFLGRDPIAFLNRVQEAHPDDFWINMMMAELTARTGKFTDALRYYQAAMALRPQSAVVHNNLGFALLGAKQFDAGIAECQLAIRYDPQSAAIHSNLALALGDAQRFDEAKSEAEEAVRISPNVALFRSNLGQILAASGHDTDAIQCYRQAIALQPNLTVAQTSLRDVLQKDGRYGDVFTAWREAVKADPTEFGAWDGYAEYCLFLGEVADYGKTRRILLDRFGNSTDPSICEHIGRACLLMPGSEDEMRLAKGMVDRAVVADAAHPTWVGPYYWFAKGLAEYRAGDYPAAISSEEGEAASALGPAPRLVDAMAHWQLGKADQARDLLKKAVASYEWNSTKGQSREQQIYVILRREAEAVIHSN